MKWEITNWLRQPRSSLTVLGTLMSFLLAPGASGWAQETGPGARPPRPLPWQGPLPPEREVGPVEAARPEVPEEASAQVSYTGRVISTEGDRLTMLLGDEERVTLRVPEETEILMNGEPADLDRLRPGDAVRIVAQGAEPRLARRVVAARVQISPGTTGRTAQAPGPERRTVRRPQTREGVPEAEGTLGITVGPTPGEIAVVTEVAPGSPADEAGIRVGDFIVRANGQQLPNMMGAQNLDHLLEQRRAGTPVRLEIWQNGQRKRVELSFGEQAGREPQRREAAYRAPGEIRLQPGEQTETGRSWIARFETADPSVRPRLEPGDRILLEAGSGFKEEREGEFPPEPQREAVPPQGEPAQDEDVTSPQAGQQQRLERLVRELSRSVRELQQEVGELKGRLEREAEEDGESEEGQERI